MVARRFELDDQPAVRAVTMRVKAMPTRRNRAVDRRWKWHIKLGNLKWLACLGDYGSPEGCVRDGDKWAEDQNLRVTWAVPRRKCVPLSDIKIERRSER